jgi:hypothetical protein
MSARRILGVVLAGGLIAAATACSIGGDPPAGENDFASAPKNKKKSGSGDDSEAANEGTKPGTPSAGTPAPPADSDAGATDAGTAADAAPTTQQFSCNQVTAATCSLARSAGSIDGDGLGTKTTIKGAGSQWISVRVNESSFEDEPLGVTARLTTPPGAELQVFLYDTGCKTPLVDPFGTAQKEAYAEWSDFPVLDNSKTVLVEIRHLSGTCTPQTEWTLELQGGFVL